MAEGRPVFIMTRQTNRSSALSPTRKNIPTMADESGGWYVRARGRTSVRLRGRSSSRSATGGNWRDFTRCLRIARPGWRRPICPSFSPNGTRRRNVSFRRLVVRGYRCERVRNRGRRPCAVRQREPMRTNRSGLWPEMEPSTAPCGSLRCGEWPPAERSILIPRCGRREWRTGCPLTRCPNWDWERLPLGSSPDPRPVCSPRRPFNNGPARTSGLAIASLVLGIIWLCGLGSLLATIFGAVALSQISRSRGQLEGKGLAIAGLVLGILGLSLFALPFFTSFLAALLDQAQQNRF